jgi:hypothetical protein
MKIGSPLRGGLPFFYSALVLLPLIILGKGVATHGQGGRTAVVFESSVDVVFVD